MSTTSIEWTDATWNPVAGCRWASPGCDHCYAARMARRLEAMGQADYQGLTTEKHFNGVVRTLPGKLDIPLSWKKPRLIFVNSMSDLFHPDVPFDYVDRVFGVMTKAYWHTFQVLTKRPDRMAEYLSNLRGKGNVITRITEAAQQFPWPEWKYADINAGGGWSEWPYRNVWLGASVENQEFADQRRDALAEVALRGWLTWVSYEPALGPVNWHRYTFLKWIVSGGESGPGARPSHPDWHRSARDFCAAHHIAYLFKQWGAWVDLQQSVACSSLRDSGNNPGFCPIDDAGQPVAGCANRSKGDVTVYRFGKKLAGRTLDGRLHDAYPAPTPEASPKP